MSDFGVEHGGAFPSPASAIFSLQTYQAELLSHNSPAPDSVMLNTASATHLPDGVYDDAGHLTVLHVNKSVGNPSGMDTLLVDMQNLENWSGTLDGLFSSAKDTEVAIGGHNALQVQNLADIGFCISDKVHMDMGENGWRFTATVENNVHFEGAGHNAGLVVAVELNSLNEDTRSAIIQISHTNA